MDEASCTVRGFDDAFRLLLGLGRDVDVDDDDDGDENDDGGGDGVSWRALSHAKRPIPVFGASARSDDVYGDGGDDDCGGGGGGGGEGEGSFFSVAHLVEGEAWTQFCEESLALLYSSQGDDESQAFESFVSVGEESLVEDFDTTFTTPLRASQQVSTAAAAARQVKTTPLSHIPPAKALQSLYPQTVSINLIAAITSTSESRTVTTRWGKKLELVEVLVGDETTSSFAVTFWLPPTSSSSSSSSNVVGALRRQDVVLLENVALAVFRGLVRGQSLRGGVTRLTLLWRADGTGCFSSRVLTSASVSAASEEKKKEEEETMGKQSEGREDRVSLLERTRVVRDWVLRFVGAAPDDPDLDRGKGAMTVAKSWDRPPDDTQ
ncbi:hypothetical protein CP532_5297 [Ophiocordyceps camponoti-leonardi (nom. inval.)]|nr:hypothetical protein CP532_5297 [Ophiocordyceps camponoti-leonardi (nom. inval.)]